MSCFMVSVTPFLCTFGLLDTASNHGDNDEIQWDIMGTASWTHTEYWG